MKTIKLVALFAAAALALSACSRPENLSADGANVVLPTPPPEEAHQILGDTTAGIAHEITLYLASDGAIELTTVTRSIRAGADGNLLRSVLDELLSSMPGGGSLLAGGAQTTFTDVEFGSGVATVRLSIDAGVNRSDQDYLLLCASIANTLLGIDGVEAVNILTGNRSNSICALPAGMFTAQNNNVPATYAQIQSERERFLDDGMATLERTACLYFPAYGDQYLLPEPRSLTFESEDYASALIKALCGGPQLRACCFSAIPANLTPLDGAPQLAVTPEGERVLDLRLSGVLSNYLAMSGLESWQLYGSLVLTLTSFLPELDAVRISADGRYVTECDMGTYLARFPDGMMRRSDFAHCIGSSAYLCFSNGSGGLTRIECAVSQAGSVSAGSILNAMITLGDSYLIDLRSVFPEGIGAEDVLGVAIDDRTAVVNLSANFYTQCQSLDDERERALIYAMVNSLCELDAIGAVRFLVEGQSVESLVGSVYLRTALLPDPGLVHDYAPDLPSD